jgi:cell division protein FtsB
MVMPGIKAQKEFRWRKEDFWKPRKLVSVLVLLMMYLTITMVNYYLL